MSALLYRHSPTYPPALKSSATANPDGGILRACTTCEITARVGAAPPLQPSPPSSPSTPDWKGKTSPFSDLPPPSPFSPYRTHDHPSMFVRAAGYCSPSAGGSVISKHKRPAAGVGVSFALSSRYNVCEALPREMSLAEQPIRKSLVSINRAEVFACIRALDRVKAVLGATTQQRRDGWIRKLVMNGGGGDSGRVTFPRLVEEVVVLTNSPYVVNCITSRAKPWRKTKAGKRRFGTLATHHTNGSSSSLSSLTRRSWSGGSGAGSGGWLIRKESKPKPADWDLFLELDLLVLELASLYGVRVCFHKATVTEASRLAREGAEDADFD